MKYLATCCSHEHLLKTLLTDIDGYIIGERFLSLNLPYTYTKEALIETIMLITQAGKEVFVDMRTLLPNEILPQVEEVLKLLNQTNVTGVIFADQAVYMIAKEKNLSIPLVWGGDTISTNWYINDFWAERGITHTLIAKELTKAAITSIDNNIQAATLVFELQGFGPLTMFHSRRSLLNNYYNHLTEIKIEKLHADTNLFLFDEERNNYYPIIEDFTGTHIFSPNDVCLIDEFEFLNTLKHFKYLKLDAKGHTTAFMDQVFNTFLTARTTFNTDIEAYKANKQTYTRTIATLYENDKRTIDKGFLYKPTIY